jgi:hypothetical protein
MTIAPLNIQQIAAVIRQQIETVNGGQRAEPGVIRSERNKEVKSGKNGTARQQPGLSGLIAQRIASLGREDPERGRKALRIFLESLLINEFGDALINDPEFYQMISEIQMRMENIPQIAASIQMAISHLLAGAEEENKES